MTHIKFFESKNIRSVWNEAEQKWYFYAQNVVEVLTDSANVKDYIKKLKLRNAQLNFNWGTICPPVEMTAEDGRKRKVQAANVRGLLRIIQPYHPPKQNLLNYLPQPELFKNKTIEKQ